MNIHFCGHITHIFSYCCFFYRDDLLKYHAVLYGNNSGVATNPEAFPPSKKSGFEAMLKSLFSTKENKSTAGLGGAIINKKSTGNSFLDFSSRIYKREIFKCDLLSCRRQRWAFKDPRSDNIEGWRWVRHPEPPGGDVVEEVAARGLFLPHSSSAITDFAQVQDLAFVRSGR